MIIEQLGKILQKIQFSEKVICPLQWASSWICICSDDANFPFPTYGVDYFINRLFATIKTAFDVDYLKKIKEKQNKSTVKIGDKYFGIEQLTKQTDITKL